MENLTQEVETLTKKINYNMRMLDYYKGHIKDAAESLAKMLEEHNGYGQDTHEKTIEYTTRLASVKNSCEKVMSKLYTLRRIRQMKKKQINGKVGI